MLVLRHRRTSRRLAAARGVHDPPKNADLGAGALAPIFMLPAEIVSLVFMFTIPSEDLLLPPSKLGAPMSAWRLTISWLSSTMCICKQWMNTAIPFLYRRIYLAYPNQMNNLLRSLKGNASLVPMIKYLNLPWFVIDKEWVRRYPRLPSQYERLYNMCRNLSGLTMVPDADVEPAVTTSQWLFGTLRFASHPLTHLEIGHPLCPGHVLVVIQHFEESLKWLKIHAGLGDEYEHSCVTLPLQITLPQLEYLGLDLTGDLACAPISLIQTLHTSKLSALSIRVNGGYVPSTETPLALCGLLEKFGSQVTFLQIHCSPVYSRYPLEPQFPIQSLLDHCPRLRSLTCDAHISDKVIHPQLTHITVHGFHYQCDTAENRLALASKFFEDSVNAAGCPKLKATRVIDSSLPHHELSFLLQDTESAQYDYPGLKFCVDSQGIHYTTDLDIIGALDPSVLLLIRAEKSSRHAPYLYPLDLDELFFSQSESSVAEISDDEDTAPSPPISVSELHDLGEISDINGDTEIEAVTSEEEDSERDSDAEDYYISDTEIGDVMARTYIPWVS